MTPTLTPEILAGAAGILISLCLAYIPKLKDKYYGLSPDYQRLVMLIALVVIALGAYGLSCLAVVSWLSCTQQGLWELLKIFVAALIANQSTYQILPGMAKTKAKAQALKANG